MSLEVGFGFSKMHARHSLSLSVSLPPSLPPPLSPLSVLVDQDVALSYFSRTMPIYFHVPCHEDNEQNLSNGK